MQVVQEEDENDPVRQVTLEEVANVSRLVFVRGAPATQVDDLVSVPEVRLESTREGELVPETRPKDEGVADDDRAQDPLRRVPANRLDAEL